MTRFAVILCVLFTSCTVEPVAESHRDPVVAEADPLAFGVAGAIEEWRFDHKIQAPGDVAVWTRHGVVTLATCTWCGSNVWPEPSKALESELIELNCEGHP